MPEAQSIDTLDTTLPRGELLIQQYRRVHAITPGYGRSSERLCGYIQGYVLSLPTVRTILDFGCGQSRTVDWLARINDARAYRYDPAIEEFKNLPVPAADLVINTDVLEHIPEDDLGALLAQIRSISPNVYFQIATAPAHTILPNGENAHCTVRPVEWWADLLRQHFDIVVQASPHQPDRCAFITWNESGASIREEALLRLSSFLGPIRGKDCIVFGSAPDPSFDASEYKGEKIICCNGSSFSLKRLFGLEPDYSFIHGHVLLRDNPADEDVRNVLARMENVGRVIFLDEEQYAHSPDALASKAIATTSFPWDDRYALLAKVINTSDSILDISTGAFSVAAACFAGAKSVRLVGISFNRKGHSYNNNDRYRNHVSSDAVVYSLLTLNGYSLTSTDPSVEMILKRIIP